MKMAVFGIDLGTSQSAGCYTYGTDEKGRPKIHIVSNQLERSGHERALNEKGFPSFVWYDENGNAKVVGLEAKRVSSLYSENTVYGTKILLGRQYNDRVVQEFKQRLKKREHYAIMKGEDNQVRIKIGPKMISPEEVASEIIEEIVKNAFQMEALLEINKMIISVPAYFNHNQRVAVKNAAFLAIGKLQRKFPERIKIDIESKQPESELEDLQLISEPTAAFLTYEEKGGLKASKDRHVLVFDLGAGTLDITVGIVDSIRSLIGDEQPLVDIEMIHGNAALGGRDMDEKLMEWAIDKLRKKENSIDKTQRQELINKLEKAKVALSSIEKTQITLTESGIVEIIPLTRAELERLIRPIVERCRKELRIALEKAKNIGLEKDEIDVVMVGGPTCMPVIRRMVQEEVGTVIKEIPDWNPMLCVAEGTVRHFGGGETTPFEYWIAVERFNKLAGKKIIPLDCTLPVKIREKVDLPVVYTDEPRDIQFYLVEREIGSGDTVIADRIRKVKLSVAVPKVGHGKTKHIQLRGCIFDGTDARVAFCNKTIEIVGEMTAEHLFKDPILEEVRWPDLPFTESQNLEIMSMQEFNKNFEEEATNYWINQEKIWDAELEKGPLPKILEVIMAQFNCTRKRAKQIFMADPRRWIDFPSPERFEELRERVANKIREAIDVGTDEENVASWKRELDRTKLPTNENIARLRCVHEAALTAITIVKRNGA